MSKPQREVWADTLIELAATNPDLLVMDADLATSTKADRFSDAYPDRFLEMGIAEQGMVGAAAGLSFTGFVPWLSSFGIFFTNRALDQVRMSVAQTHQEHTCEGQRAGHSGPVRDDEHYSEDGSAERDGGEQYNER